MAFSIVVVAIGALGAVLREIAIFHRAVALLEKILEQRRTYVDIGRRRAPECRAKWLKPLPGPTSSIE